MKFPKHVILDINKPRVSNTSQYWVLTYLLLSANKPSHFDNLFFNKKFLLKKENLMLNKLIKNQKKYTIKYNLTNPANFLNSTQKKFYKNFFSTRVKVKSLMRLSKHEGKVIYDYLYKSKTKIDFKTINRLFVNFKYINKTKVFKNNKLWKLFDIYFLKKEKIYTKLKYSRVPQYDMVSGGSAAFLAAFVGFLITEKFGFELLDSGDFYYLFMYFVFFIFFIKLFSKLINDFTSDWNILSYKWAFCFYKTITKLFINFFKSLLNK